MPYLSSTARWSLALWLVAACGSSSGGPSGNGSSSGHPFACGSATCDSATQYCSRIVGGVALPDASNTGSASCAAWDGGVPSCSGGSATAPGQCGCYESSTGEVTITECIP